MKRASLCVERVKWREKKRPQIERRTEIKSLGNREFGGKSDHIANPAVKPAEK